GRVFPTLRTARIAAPTVSNDFPRSLAERAVITLLGFDPLWQFVHEVDAIAAFKLAIDRDFPGAFNIVGEGVLPISKPIKIAGRTALPIFHPIAETLIAASWAAQAVYAP